MLCEAETPYGIVEDREKKLILQSTRLVFFYICIFLCFQFENCTKGKIMARASGGLHS